jgi:hypothetical protein
MTALRKGGSVRRAPVGFFLTSIARRHRRFNGESKDGGETAMRRSSARFIKTIRFVTFVAKALAIIKSLTDSKMCNHTILKIYA